MAGRCEDVKKDTQGLMEISSRWKQGSPSALLTNSLIHPVQPRVRDPRIVYVTQLDELVTKLHSPFDLGGSTSS